MYQGFYNLTSGMLTQSRNLNVVSNNMANIQTAGYKKDTMVSSTFQEEMLYRTGRRAKENREELAVTSKIRTASRTYVDYEQGSMEPTEGIYDFAIQGRGFFCIQTEDGVRYTRDGSFSVDNQGYLVLNDQGRVLGKNNRPIKIDNENFNVDNRGNITVEETVRGKVRRTTLGSIRVVDFENYENLHKEDNGMFSTDQNGRQVGNDTAIAWKCLERANVNMVDEMTNMMSSQRALQSAAQVLTLYDQVMGKSASEVGSL